MKKLPKFKSEEEEARFWDTHDVLEYSVDSDELIVGGPKTEAIHLRIEPQVKRRLEELARSRNMDFSDLLRSWIYEDLDRALAGGPGRSPTDELTLSLQSQLSEINQGVSSITEMMQERGSRQMRNITYRRDALPKAAAKKKPAAAKKKARRK